MCSVEELFGMKEELKSGASGQSMADVAPVARQTACGMPLGDGSCVPFPRCGLRDKYESRKGHIQAAGYTYT